MVAQSASGQGSEACLLAKRVPKVTRTGDEAQDKILEEQRSALIGIINTLNRQPELCMATYLALTEGKITAAATDRSEWSDSYNCIQRFPKYFKAQLLALDSTGGLTQDDLNRINSTDPEAICVLFNIATQMPDSTAVPREILDKQWSSKIFMLRMAQLGHRIRQLRSTSALAADGTIDWTRFSCYVGEWNEAGDTLTRLVLISGDKADMPAALKFGQKYSVSYHADEMQTQFMFDDGVYVTCHQRFADGEGPHRHNIGKGKAKQIDKFKELSAGLCEMPMSSQPRPIIPDPKYLAKSEADAKEVKKAKAKARLATEGSQRKRARSVLVT